ncbi:hypothetical protein KPL70_020746 [Citrus sinensis]|nr:hypothetical protein KPL70_020746 [Citrus sinensis]
MYVSITNLLMNTVFTISSGSDFENFEPNGTLWRLLASFITFAVFLFFTSSLLFTFHSPYRDLYSSGLNSGTYGLVSIRRSVLALKSDSLKPRLDQIRKQADDHRALAVAYASYARKLKVENSKMVRIFADLSRNYTDPIFHQLSW